MVSGQTRNITHDRNNNFLCQLKESTVSFLREQLNDSNVNLSMFLSEIESLFLDLTGEQFPPSVALQHEREFSVFGAFNRFSTVLLRSLKLDFTNIGTLPAVSLTVA